MNRRRSLLLTAVLAIGVMVLGACSGGGGSTSASSASAAPKKGGSLTVGIEGSWVSLDPVKATSYNSYDVLLTMYDQLFDLDKKGDLVPNLAKSEEVSSDGLTYTVKLQTGVKFQDGTPFDAEAAKINLDRARDASTGCTCYGNMQTITSVEAPSPDTLVIKLSQPNAGFPKIVLASNGAIMASPAEIKKGDLATNPIGTGPFKFDSQVAGSSVTVKAWDGYRQPGRPYLDGVTFKVIPDVDARYASLTSGAINVADNVSNNSLAPAKSDSSLKILPQGALGSTFVMFQVGGDGPLKDPKARAAACMAINPEAINQTLFAGTENTGMESMFPKGSPDDPGKVDGYPSYDAKKAKQMVKDLGGLSFKLEIATSPDNVKVAQALVAQWKTAGIDVTIGQTDQPTLVQNAFAHNFEAMLYRWRGAMDPDGNISPWFSSAFATPDKPSTNYNLVSNPKVDELIKQGQSTTDPAARKKIYAQVSEELAKITPYCYLWAADWYRITKTDVYGIPDRPDNIMTLTDAYVNAG